jgi:flagellar assembly protein FliH
MTKAVFRLGELVEIGAKVSLDPPFPETVKDEIAEIEELDDLPPIFSGPTADDLRHEAELFKVSWEKEKESMMNAAHSEAETIVTAAKKTAEDEAERMEAVLEANKLEAEERAKSIISEAGEKAHYIEETANSKMEDITKAAAAEGFEKGRKEGHESGMNEMRRLIARTQLVMERIQDRRLEILEQSEQEVVDLALIISRKVVKIISENQRQVVVENIKDALSRIKTKGKVIVKVNLADLEVAAESLDEFIKQIESSGTIQILEDSSIDAGGCYVETDFGDVDARIAIQFAELESKILEISPVKKK